MKRGRRSTWFFLCCMILWLTAIDVFFVKVKGNGELIVKGNDVMVIEDMTYVQTDAVYIIEEGTLIIRSATLNISEDFGVSIKDQGKLLLENGKLTGKDIQMRDQANLTATNNSSIMISKLTGTGNSTIILSNHSILHTSGTIDFSGLYLYILSRSKMTNLSLRSAHVLISVSAFSLIESSLASGGYWYYTSSDLFIFSSTLLISNSKIFNYASWGDSMLSIFSPFIEIQSSELSSLSHKENYNSSLAISGLLVNIVNSTLSCVANVERIDGDSFTQASIQITGLNTSIQGSKIKIATTYNALPSIHFFGRNLFVVNSVFLVESIERNGSIAYDKNMIARLYNVETASPFSIGENATVYKYWWLSVYVVDKNGVPVYGANVNLIYPRNSSIAESRTTDATGFARIQCLSNIITNLGDLFTGNYQVEAKFQNYIPVRRYIQMGYNQELTLLIPFAQPMELLVSIKMNKLVMYSGEAFTATVYVTDNITNNIVENVLVTMGSAGQFMRRSEGPYSFQFDAPIVSEKTTYTFAATASKSGYVTGQAAILITVLPPLKGSLHIHLLDQEGNALSDVLISSITQPKAYVSSLLGITNASGDLIFDSIPIGFYQMQFDKSGYERVTKGENVTENQTTYDTVIMTKQRGLQEFQAGTSFYWIMAVFVSILSIVLFFRRERILLEIKTINSFLRRLAHGEVTLDREAILEFLNEIISKVFIIVSVLLFLVGLLFMAPFNQWISALSILSGTILFVSGIAILFEGPLTLKIPSKRGLGTILVSISAVLIVASVVCALFVTPSGTRLVKHVSRGVVTWELIVNVFHPYAWLTIPLVGIGISLFGIGLLLSLYDEVF